MKLNELIRECREKSGLSQLQLAKKLGYDQPQMVSHMETGIAKPPLKIIGKMVVLIGLPEMKVTKHLIIEFIAKMNKEIEDGKNEIA